jgi:hypothetical protein
MSVVRIASFVFSPAPSHARASNPSVEDDVGNSLIASLCSESNLVSNIGHDVGLSALMDISINIDCSNNPSLCIRIVVANTELMTLVRHPSIRAPITISEGVIKLQS